MGGGFFEGMWGKVRRFTGFEIILILKMASGPGRCFSPDFVPYGPKAFEFVLVSLKNLT